MLKEIFLIAQEPFNIHFIFTVLYAHIISQTSYRNQFITQIVNKIDPNSPFNFQNKSNNHQDTRQNLNTRNGQLLNYFLFNINFVPLEIFRNPIFQQQ